MDKNVTSNVAANSGSLSNAAVTELSETLRRLLADGFCLYLKTKTFHWHMTGSHFRDYHLLPDEQADQVFAMTDVLAERARKIGCHTLRSIGDSSRRQRLRDSDEERLTPQTMLSELRDDSSLLMSYMRETRVICAKYNNVPRTSLIEARIDEPERRTWLLTEARQTRALRCQLGMVDALATSMRARTRSIGREFAGCLPTVSKTSKFSISLRA